MSQLADPATRSRLGLVPLLLLAAFVPVIAYGLLHVESDTTDMHQWLPADQLGRKKYDEFVRKFGPDDFVVVSWDGCTLVDPRLSQFTTRLRAANGHGATRLIRRVVSPGEVVADLATKSRSISPTSAVKRLKSYLIGLGGQCCLLIEVTEAGNLDPHGVIELIRQSSHRVGVTRSQLKLGGGIYEATHIDEMSLQSFKRYVGFSAVVGLVVAWLSLRSLTLTLIVVATGGYCGGLSVALIYFCSMRFNALMLVLPTLVYVLVISGSVHLVNYYLDARRDPKSTDPAVRALSVGWLPCTLASVTTAIGLTSLAASQIQHVRSFGIFAAAALLLSLLVMLILVPSMLSALGSYLRLHANPETPRLTDVLANQILARHRLILLVSLVLLAMFVVGLTRTTSSVKIERMFRADDELVQSYQWFERNIGPLAAMEIVVNFSPDDARVMHQRLDLVRTLARQVSRHEEVGTTFSAANLLPSPPRATNVRGAAARAVFNKKLAAALPWLQENRLVVQAEEGQVWRITARIPALEELNYEDLLHATESSIESVIQTEREGSGVTAQVTGTILVMNQARQQLLRDLIITFSAAFALICPVMIVILRSFVAGIASMLPNLVPAVAVFGAMGWLGVPIEIGTVLTACVALGIAVDDTLHFLTWYRRSLNESGDRAEAIRMAYRRSALAMVQTTLICGMGLLVFAASSFVPTSRFAVLMFALLVAALIGDLILLPALLAGPCGRYFVRRRGGTSEE